MKKLVDEVAELFSETAHAHHQAFIETDGEDPEWPLWYAGYLYEGLSSLLKIDMTKSELVYLLIWVDRAHSRAAPEIPWNQYYAIYFVKRFDGTLPTSIDDMQ